MPRLQVETEDINDDYSWGVIGDFRVIIRKEDGYINVSKLIKDSSREYKTWHRSAKTKEYIREVAEFTELDISDLLQLIKGGTTDICRLVSGTYGHPDLAIHAAQWCSAKFHLRTTHILQDHFNKEARNARRQLEKKVKKQKDTITDLLARIDAQNVEMNRKMDAQNAKMNAQSAEMNAQNAKMTQKVEVVTDTLHRVEGELYGVSRKLDVAKDQRVPPAKNPKTVHHTVVLRLNVEVEEESEESDDEETAKPVKKETYEYACLRVQKHSMASSIASKKKKYPNAEVILDMPNPNSMNIWHRYYEVYGEMVVRRGIDYSLKDGYSERRMLRHMRRVIQGRHGDSDLN